MLGTVIIFGILFGIILIHEAGHLVIAKKYGVGVPIYSIGFGPRIVGFKFFNGKMAYKILNYKPSNQNIWDNGETEYRIAPIPLGGYCKMAGELVGSDKPNPKDLTSKTYFQKVMVAMGGAIANLITGFLAVYAVVATKIGIVAGLKLTVLGILESIKYSSVHLWNIIKGIQPVAKWAEISDSVSNITSFEELVVQFGLLSIIMALFNLIPFPALDGSLPFLWGLENVFGKKKGQKIANILVMIGFTLLMGLQLLIVFYWIITAWQA